MQEIAQALSQATYVEIPQAGHMSPLENPAVFNEALGEFLASAVR
jgi:pimeloyl-ACP methyl ester carboxylesterase